MRRKFCIFMKLLLIILFSYYWIGFLFSIEIIDDFKEDISVEEVREETSNFSFNGFLKQFGHYTKPYENEELIYSNTELLKKNLFSSITQGRLGIAFKLKHFKFELLSDNKILFSNFTKSDEFNFHWMSNPRNRFFTLEYKKKTDDYFFQESIHRLIFSYFTEHLQVTLGRQAISWGQGRFLNPIDLITPSGPFIFDIEDLTGSDSLNVLYYLNSLDFIQAVVTPYRRENQKDYRKIFNEKNGGGADVLLVDTNFLLRFKKSIQKIDISILSGYQFHTYVWGYDFSISKWGASFRTAYLGRQENSYFYDKLNLDSYIVDRINISHKITYQFTVGVSYAFWEKLKTSLELFYNSNSYSKDENLAYMLYNEQYIQANISNPIYNDVSFFKTAGRVITKNPFVLQLSLDYEIVTALSGAIILMNDIEKQGYYLNLQLTYNLSDESVMILNYRNAYVFDDNNESDFSNYKPEVSLIVRWYF